MMLSMVGIFLVFIVAGVAVTSVIGLSIVAIVYVRQKARERNLK